MSDRMKADLDDGYTRIANKIMQALFKCPLLNREARVLMFIIYQTYGYRHKERPLSLTYIGKGTGIASNHICKIVQKLVDANIVKKSFKEDSRNQILGINTKVYEWCDTPISGTTKSGSGGTPIFGSVNTPISGSEYNKEIYKKECVGENGKSRFPDTKIFDRLWAEWSYSQAGKERVSRKVREEIEGIGYARMNEARLRYEQDLNMRTTKNNQPLSARTWFLGGFRQYLPQVGENGMWKSINGKTYFGEVGYD